MNALVVSKINEVAVTLDVVALGKRDAAIAGAKTVSSVDDPLTLEDAVSHLKSLQSLSKMAEKSRSDVKSPVLELGRSIDAKAKEFCAPIDIEVSRINRLVNAFQIEQRKKAEEAERARQAELARIESERLKAAEAEERLRREAAEKEAARLRAEAEANSKFDEAEESAALVQAQEAENKKLELEIAAEQERQRQSTLAAEKARAQSQMVTAPSKVSGLVGKDVWKFEVTDLKALYAANPAFCRLEANTSAINDAMRTGLRECPGLRIYSEFKSEVRS